MEKQKTIKLMIDRELQIQGLLWKEVALKSRSASIIFGIVSVFLFLYHFNLTDLKPIIQACCIIVISSNILRVWITGKIIDAPVLNIKHKNFLRLMIWLNAIAWSVMFSVSSFELNSSSFDFAVLMAILTGSIAGSIVTLGYDRSIFIPYQCIIIIPMMGVSIYQYHQNLNPNGHYLAFIYSLFFVYQLKQFKSYREQLMQRFNAQLDLEFSFMELKKSQSSLVEQTAKLIHASKINALSEMAGGLAHEVNNSLMVIMGSTQQVQRELKKNELLSQSLDTKMEQSTNAILKIKAVIEGLKYFSLQMEPQPKEVINLSEIVSRTLSYTHELLKAQNITLTLSESPDVKLFCHPFQITQILFNLTKNAEDAMENSTGPKWLKYEFEKSGENILIKLSNNGTNITPSNHSKLFQPFFSTKDVNQGTGLSLSISKGIAMDHQGDLFFEEGEFTTFILKLPMISSK